MMFKQFRHAVLHRQRSLFSPDSQIRFGWRSLKDECLPSEGAASPADVSKRMECSEGRFEALQEDCGKGLVSMIVTMVPHW